LRITAKDCLDLRVVDEVVPEPLGGAHRYPSVAIASVGEAICRHLAALDGAAPGALRAARYDRFRNLGPFVERPLS
jgi:acetyl-CoA carboxylase carboxyl transferase subunit alpha